MTIAIKIADWFRMRRVLDRAAPGRARRLPWRRIASSLFASLAAAFGGLGLLDWLATASPWGNLFGSFVELARPMSSAGMLLAGAALLWRGAGARVLLALAGTLFIFVAVHRISGLQVLWPGLGPKPGQPLVNALFLSLAGSALLAASLPLSRKTAGWANSLATVTAVAGCCLALLDGVGLLVDFVRLPAALGVGSVAAALALESGLPSRQPRRKLAPLATAAVIAAVSAFAIVDSVFAHEGVVDGPIFILSVLVAIASSVPFLAVADRRISESESVFTTLRDAAESLATSATWQWDVEEDLFDLAPRLRTILGLPADGPLTRSVLEAAVRATKAAPFPPDPSRVPDDGRWIDWEAQPRSGGPLLRGRGRTCEIEGRTLVVGAVTEISRKPSAPVQRSDASTRHDAPAPTEPVALGHVLERIRSGIGQKATLRGYEARFVPTSAVVMSEPVALERAIRTLVEGAIETEGVYRLLIGCRRTRGETSLYIYRELSRAAEGTPNRPSFASQPDTAMARRVAGSIGHPSTAGGRGRVQWIRFTLPAASGALQTPDSFGMTVALISRQEEARRLLTAEMEEDGHLVDAAGSAEEFADNVAAVPDVLVYDARPFSWRAGLEDIGFIRRACGWDIPAVILAGSGSSSVDQPMENISVLGEPLFADKVRVAIKSAVGGQGWAR